MDSSWTSYLLVTAPITNVDLHPIIEINDGPMNIDKEANK